MNFGEFKEIYEEQKALCNKKVDLKAEQYARIDRLSNFKEAALLAKETPQQAAWGMVIKHIIWLRDMILYDPPASITKEALDEVITDIMVYMVLIKAIIIEQKGENNDRI